MQKLIAGAKRLGLDLTSRQIEQFEIYYRELIAWNKKMNLTTITGYEKIQLKHFLDSLTVILACPDLNSRRLIDVGSGAGLPGIPLTILFPRVRMVLLDSITKKATFLEHIIQKLGLENVMVITRRAEQVAHQEEHREKFDIVLSRAVARLPVLVELTLPFCSINGTLVAQKKGLINAEVEESIRAIKEMGGKLRQMKKVNLPDLEDERWLIVIDKLSPTPPKYPRRPGIPAKRPLL